MIESWFLLLRGFLIGLSIAAPVGPIGVLCIRRTLSNGKLAGFLSGMGAATAHRSRKFAHLISLGRIRRVSLLVVDTQPRRWLNTKSSYKRLYDLD